MTKLNFCDIEFFILNDTGASNIARIFNNFSKDLSITSLRIYGDIHSNNYGNISSFTQIVADIRLSQLGFKHIGDLFHLPSLQMVQEFRFNDFNVEPFAFMTLIDALINHHSLSQIEFCRDEINEDTACAVI